MTSPCPAEPTLQRFLLGQLSPEEADSLDAHLGACEHCVAALATLSDDDSLIASMQRLGLAAERPVLQSDRLLADWLKGLRAGSAAPRDADDRVTRLYSPAGLGHTAPGECIGCYELRTVLDLGGMGVVFEAYDLDLKRPVALKTILPALACDPSARQRFLREARAAAAIKHDHIITIHHVGEDQGVAYLVMELLEGETLEHRLRRERRLPTRELLRIARECALGLAAAHAHQLIHRDIKPSNLWLETRAAGREADGESPPPPRVKILDFGLALPVSDKDRVTLHGAILGTPAFMAPEQLEERAIDGRADLFSLGCVMYRLATGTPPFGGRHSISTLVAIATTQPRPPRELEPSLPAAVCDLIMRLLAKDPAERPASAAELVELIQVIEQGTAPPRRQRARRAPWLVLVALAIGLGFFGAWALWTRPTAKARPEEANTVTGLGKGPGQIFADPGHGLEEISDHRDIVGVDAPGLRRWLRLLGPELRLASLGVRHGKGPPLFHAVAVRENAPRLVRYRLALPEDSRPAIIERMADDGFRPLSVARHGNGESLLWTEDGIKGVVETGPLADLPLRLQAKRAAGCRPVAFDASAGPEGTRFTCIFAEVRDRLWETEHGLGADELSAAVAAYRKRGYRPDLVAAYPDKGRVRFLLSAVGNDEGPDWRFRLEMTPEQYEVESAEQRARGLFPLSIAGYRDEADPRYAAVWVRYRTDGAEPGESEPAERDAKVIAWTAAGQGGLFQDKARALAGVTDYRELVGKPVKAMADWLDHLDPAFRPVLVTSRQGYGVPRYNVVAVRETNQPRFRRHIELSSDAIWKKDGEDGYRPLVTCSRYSETFESGWGSTQLWVMDGQPHYCWFGWLSTVVAGNRDCHQAGYRPIWMDAAPSPEGVGTSTLLGPDQGRAWKAYYTLTAEELFDAIDHCRRTQWRPDILVPYREEDEQRHMLVVVKNDDRIDWHFRTDMSQKEYERHSEQWKRHGYFPLALAPLWTDMARYAAVFVRYRRAAGE
jgi:hypothetical protein